MKRLSSASIGKGEATLKNAKHNDRTTIPSYLLIRKMNYIWVDVDHTEVKRKLQRLLKDTSAKRKEIGKKKVSTQTHTLKELVVNLDRHHNVDTMQQIKGYLFKKFNIHVLQLAIHFDEGVLLEKAGYPASEWDLSDYYYDSGLKKWVDKTDQVTYDIIVYQPGKNIFWNTQSSKWYLDQTFKKPLDMSKVKHKINHHGHILFYNLDEHGNSIARTLRPYLSNLQDDIAKITGMERNYSTKRRGQNHKNFKHESALSAKEDELIRKNIELYNLNEKLIKELARMDPKILETKDPNEIYDLATKAISNFKRWKIFAIKQYRLLGFSYKKGDKLDTNKAIIKIGKKLEKVNFFINSIYNIFKLQGMYHDAAIKHLKKLYSPTTSIKSTLNEQG